MCGTTSKTSHSSPYQHGLSKAAVRFVINDAYADTNQPDRETVRRYYDLLLRAGNRPAVREIARTYRADNREHCGDRHLLPTLPSVHEPYAGICDPYCISDVDAPVLFQWGTEDEWLPISFGRDLAARVADSRFHAYEQVGHVPMEERPAETAADARAFVDSL
jgi:pimeloyl-ACP methyl ester carboxylesterase